jgi:hypothetical protein
MVGLLVCLFCKYNVTLRRLKPYKSIYACQSCIKGHGGMDEAVRITPQFVKTFHQRKAGITHSEVAV